MRDNGGNRWMQLYHETLYPILDYGTAPIRHYARGRTLTSRCQGVRRVVQTG